MENKQGPSIRNIPQQSFKVCHGCEFLDKQAGMRGHKRVTNNFNCIHPDFKGEYTLGQRGRTIHYNHEGDCTTPNWCPFLQPKEKEKDYCTCPDFGFYEIGEKKFCSRCNRENPPSLF